MISKQEAKYTDHPPWVAGKRCALCSMFRLPDNCTLVKGVIDPFGACSKWAMMTFWPSRRPPGR